MARLVVLSEGLTGRSYDLKVDKTTVGRLDDNAFQIPEGSVSSHHCEILLKGTDVIVKDLNSTNGTFINGQAVTGETALKSGQILRLGQIELRLESGEPKPASGKKLPDHTMVIPQGVKFGDLDQQGGKPVNFDKDSPFSKKSNSKEKMFITGAIIIGMLILGAILFFILQANKIGPGTP